MSLMQKVSKQHQASFKARAPMNVSELRAFLGLVNSYGHFISNLATSQHRAIILSAYSYDIRFRRTEDHANADCLLNYLWMLLALIGAKIQALPVTAAKLRECSRQNSLLSRVINVYMPGLACHCPLI